MPPARRWCTDPCPDITHPLALGGMPSQPVWTCHRADRRLRRQRPSKQALPWVRAVSANHAEPLTKQHGDIKRLARWALGADHSGMISTTATACLTISPPPIPHSNGAFTAPWLQGSPAKRCRLGGRAGNKTGQARVVSNAVGHQVAWGSTACQGPRQHTQTHVVGASGACAFALALLPLPAVACRCNHTAPHGRAV